MPDLHKMAAWEVQRNILRQGHCAADNKLAGIIQVNRMGVKHQRVFFRCSSICFRSRLVASVLHWSGNR